MVKGWEAVSSPVGAGAVMARLSIGKMKMAVNEIRKRWEEQIEGGNTLSSILDMFSVRF